MATKLTKKKQLEKALSDVLDIIDGKEHMAEVMMAWTHGLRCDLEVSKRNGEIIDAAYELIGKERPEFNDTSIEPKKTTS